MSSTSASFLLVLLMAAITAQGVAGIRLSGGSMGAFHEEKVQVESMNLQAYPCKGTAHCSTSTSLKMEHNTGEGAIHHNLLEDYHAPGDAHPWRSSTKFMKNKKKPVMVSLPLLKPTPPPTTREKYPDLIDLVGMDYSPAIGKPPIHN